MSKVKRKTKANTNPKQPLAIRLTPEHVERLMAMAKHYGCVNRQKQTSWRGFIDRLRMLDDGTMYVE